MQQTRRARSTRLNVKLLVQRTSRIDAVQKVLAARPDGGRLFSTITAETLSRRGKQALSQKNNVGEMRQ